jgi:putative hemolysin
MNSLQITYLVVFTICIGASGFFSGSETALIGIQRERVHQLEDTPRGAKLAALVADPDRLLSTLLVANNFVNILAAAVATTLFIDLAGQDWGPWLATLVVTTLILVIGEITPKSLAARYPEQFSLRVAPSIWRLSRVLRPVSRVFQGIAKVLFRVFRLPADATPHLVTEDDIRSMALLGEQEGEIETVEREIIHALFELADRPVREVMTPRVDIVALAEPVVVSDVREAVASTGHSRFPVTIGSLDSIVGVLYVKDLLRRPFDPEPHEVRKLFRKPVYVPESKPILELLQEMKAGKRGFAVVSDEHGGVEGVVTVKDLVSELTGELRDEFDPGVPSLVRVRTEEWIADGRVSLEELADEVKVELPKGEYATAGGLFLHLAGRIPDEGDSMPCNGLTLTVVRMDRNRIDRLKVQTM